MEEDGTPVAAAGDRTQRRVNFDVADSGGRSGGGGSSRGRAVQVDPIRDREICVSVYEEAPGFRLAPRVDPIEPHVEINYGISARSRNMMKLCFQIQLATLNQGGGGGGGERGSGGKSGSGSGSGSGLRRRSFSFLGGRRDGDGRLPDSMDPEPCTPPVNLAGGGS